MVPWSIFVVEGWEGASISQQTTQIAPQQQCCREVRASLALLSFCMSAFSESSDTFFMKVYKFGSSRKCKFIIGSIIRAFPCNKSLKNSSKLSSLVSRSFSFLVQKKLLQKARLDMLQERLLMNEELQCFLTVNLLWLKLATLEQNPVIKRLTTQYFLLRST